MSELEYLVGLRVGQISFGLGVSLELWGATSAVDAAKLDAGPVRSESPSGSITELDVTQAVGTGYAPLLALYGCAISAARVDEKANVLELVFDAGDRFLALPMKDAEGWQLAGPGDRFMVAVPGGEVTAWG